MFRSSRGHNEADIWNILGSIRTDHLRHIYFKSQPEDDPQRSETCSWLTFIFIKLYF